MRNPPNSTSETPQAIGDLSQDAQQKRSNLLILTAGFGEGHNSAANALASLAKESHRFNPIILDPIQESLPKLTRFLQSSYRFCTRYLPCVWHGIYESTDRINLSHFPEWLTHSGIEILQENIKRYKPEAILSTYPIYPYWVNKIFENSSEKPPQFVVVTDSITINSTWTRCEATKWFVTDFHTRSTLLGQDIPSEKIIVSGFPVDRSFCHLPNSCLNWQPGMPFRILYFASQSKPLVRQTIQALLDANPDIYLSIVLGRHKRSQLRRALKICKPFKKRTHLIGWSNHIAPKMHSHHLIVGKAGGATVHEAIAAKCPMLINHLVPGQEEGNALYLQKLGGGFEAADAFDLKLAIRSLLADKGLIWKNMKHDLEIQANNCAAKTIIFAIDHHLMFEKEQSANLPPQQEN